MGCKGITISLVERLITVTKAESNFGITRTPNIASIDAHTILSRDYLLFLDALNDWRTKQNPLVTGSPHIKFYLGIPLVAPNNVVIGVLAIFEPFPLDHYTKENIAKLQSFAKQLMKALAGPVEEFQSNLGITKSSASSSKSMRPNDDLSLLQRQFGRATSRGCNAIFEKDGSGSPYSQNNNLRFSRYYNAVSSVSNELPNLSLPNQQLLRNNPRADSMLSPNSKISMLNQILYQRLLNAASFKAASVILSKTIMNSLNFDFVYFLEVRIAEPFQIKREYFPSTDKKINMDSFEFPQHLIRKKGDKKSFLRRVIEASGRSSYGKLKYEEAIHKEAFLSDYGISYKSKHQTALYNEGILMAIHKSESSLHKRSRINSKTSSDMVDVYLKGSGYLVACFNESRKNNIDEKTIVQVLEYCSMLKKIYLQQ